MALKINTDLLRTSFMEDAAEHMEAFERALLQLEKDRNDDEAINTAFRAVHTMKGSGGIFGFDELIRFSHSLENLLDALRERLFPTTPEIISLLFAGFDHLQALLRFYKNESPQEKIGDLAHASDIIMLRLRQLQSETHNNSDNRRADNGHTFRLFCRPDFFRSGLNLENALRYLIGQTPVRSVRILPHTLPDLKSYNPETAYLGLEISLAVTGDRAQALVALNDAFEFLLPELTLEEVPATEAEIPEAPGFSAKKNPRPESTSSVRVDSAKLDDFMNLVGELVMKNGTLLQLARDRGARDFMRPISEMTRLVESVREMAMVMRMVSIGPTFRKMERIARDVAAQTGKEVGLVFDGEETELDKNLIEKISDPLMHIIRNAVDHGIESAEERTKAGKTAAGKIILRARHEAGMILIEISDDGRGLDFEKILQRARERDLAEKDRNYSDAEIQQFIFLPGFSTAAQISEVSGRGVGMDVVKKNIDMLRGSVRLSSEQGRGMTMRIALPLTLAIIDGFLVRSGMQKFVIPLDVIKECVDFRLHRRKAVKTDSRLFNLRGEVLPYIRLSDLFRSVAEKNERESLIVIQQGDFRFGVVIDEPLGEYQTVIKPLTGFLAGIPGLGGATVLGSRDLALIIDVRGLIDLISEDKEKKQGTIAEAI